MKTLVRLLIVVAFGLLLAVQQPAPVSADTASADIDLGIGGCRTDPILILSNGATMQIIVNIGTNAGNIQRVLYAVHLPQGVTVQRIVYTGNSLTGKENTVVVNDAPKGQYVTDTIVTLSTSIAPVSVLSSVQTNDGFATQLVAGTSGKHLVALLTP